MNNESKSIPFELKATDQGEKNIFEGYGGCFNNIDDYGDIIAPGAFTDSIDDFLKTGIIVWQHDWTNPIGRPLAVSEDAKGLYLKAKVSDTTLGNDAMTLMRDGVVQKLSIGYRTKGREFLESADDVMAYWKSVGYTPTAADIASSQYGARLLTAIKLYEISPVSVPANGLCDITAAKHRQLVDSDGQPLDSGLTLENHSKAVLAACQELIERVQGVKAKRSEDGGRLSAARVRDLKHLYDQLTSLLATPAEDQAEDYKSDAEASNALFAQFQRTVATLNGVA